MSRAEYMRDYRARKKARPVENAVTDGRMLGWDCPICDQHVTSMIVLNDENRARIAELEEEIRHLKAELAKRPGHQASGVTYPMAEKPIDIGPQLERFNTRPFTPVPKGK